MIAITNYGFVIDNRRCIGCHACTVACKTEHDDPVGVYRTWVKYVEEGKFPDTNRHFSVMRCNHCADAPCTDLCPVTALWERSDGIVDFDPERCVGCKACMQACPYDACYIDPETSTAAKCNYCSHRVDSGREPACATVCPEDAIVAGDLEDADSDISRTVANQEVQVRKPEKGTGPTTFYVDGDEGSITPGATDREEHYMWSDAPRQAETRGAMREEFDLQRAAESLAESDVDRASDEPRADGGCDCADDCTCGENPSGEQVASDGGYGPVDYSQQQEPPDITESETATARASELLRDEARRVYDVDEDHDRSWGWEVYSYTWTKSISAGLFLLAALFALVGVGSATATTVGGAAVLSLGFLGLTTVLLVLDLERPLRFHWVLLRPNWRSWLVRGGYILTVSGGFLTLVAVGWLAGATSLVTHPLTLTAGIGLAAAIAVYTAFLLGQAKGRDLWQSPAMPLHLLAQAIVAGGAAMVLLAVAGVPGFEATMDPAAGALLGGLTLHTVLVGSEVFTQHQTQDAEAAVERVVSGRFRTAFWGGAVLVGIAVPAVATVAGGSVGLAVAGVAALLGLFAFEYCWIIAPQTISLA